MTGVAGFIGSHLAARLLADGHDVTGVDCFTTYYDLAMKRANLESLKHDRFHFLEADLRVRDPAPMLRDVDVVFHQAGQPGVRLSWAAAFHDYADHNILVTQRLLEAARSSPVSRFVFASSSSLYGNAAAYPTRETDLPRPHSPYGVTKLAAEHLCGLYATNWGVPTVSLRYFTVYGPRQRPDMAFHRLIEAALVGKPFELYGTGQQIRDFTYVGDIVAANCAAASAPAAAGSVVNVAGGSSTTMNEVIDLIRELAGAEISLIRFPAQPGDVQQTGGSIELARTTLGWQPTIELRDGLAEQIHWHKQRLGI